MFIIFIALIAMSLTTVAAHMYMALALQAQTVTYAIQAVTHQQYLHGVLAYALASLVDDKDPARTCDLFYTKDDGYLTGLITYTKSSQGYLVRVVLMRADEQICGLHASVVYESRGGKTTYSCVALEPF